MTLPWAATSGEAAKASMRNLENILRAFGKKSILNESDIRMEFYEIPAKSSSREC